MVAPGGPGLVLRRWPPGLCGGDGTVEYGTPCRTGCLRPVAGIVPASGRSCGGRRGWACWAAKGLGAGPLGRRGRTTCPPRRGATSACLRTVAEAGYGRATGKGDTRGRARAARRAYGPAERPSACVTRPGDGEGVPALAYAHRRRLWAAYGRVRRGAGDRPGWFRCPGTPARAAGQRPSALVGKHAPRPAHVGVHRTRSVMFRTGGRAPARPRRRVRSALAACGRRRLVKPGRLVLDLGALGAERRNVLTSVVSAEQQLPADRQDRANVGLGAATVAPVKRRQRLGGGKSSSHVSPFGSFPTAVGDSASVTCNNI